MKLTTWNIQWGRGADGRVDLDPIVAHARRFADFDVWCVQEVSAGHQQLPSCDGSDQFEQLAARLAGHAPVAGVATDAFGPDGRRRRFGNMLFSRLPVRQVFRHLLPWPAEAGVTSMQRVAIEATLDTPLGPLRVTTTHLAYCSARQRAAQIDRLRALHREAVTHAQARGPAPPRMSHSSPCLARQRPFSSATSTSDPTTLITPACLRRWTRTQPNIAMPGNWLTLAVRASGRSACATRRNGQAHP